MSVSMPEFRVTRPQGVAEAVAARSGQNGSAVVAGGTDLLVNMRHGLRSAPLLIDLSAIDELRGIEETAGGLRIGAGVRIAEIEAHPVFASQYRAVGEAARAIAAPGHRKMGSVGGNLCLDTRCVYYNQSEWWRSSNGYCLKERGDVCHVAPQGERCHAAFSGDLAPALLAFGATVEIAGTKGRRHIPLADLYVEDGRAHLTLAGDEIVVAVHLPKSASRSTYAKVRVRDAIDYPLAGVAVVLQVADGRLQELRIGLTGTNSRPLLLDGTDALLGKPVDDEALTQIDRLVQKQVQPMRTTLVSAQYRRLAAAGLARKLVKQLAAAG
jgi:4-hydroxybenzoyl-CoA reductase subunit beta